MTLVNSYNEWDPLEEVIVGNGFPDTLPLDDYSFKLFFHENISGEAYNYGDDKITERHINEHTEDLENLCDLLKSLGVKVKRPKVPKMTYRTKTPWWDSITHPALNVRDMAMIVGNMVIESAPTCRYRYFENDFLSHLFLEYFKSGSRWVQAPKPLMLDNSFDTTWIDEDTGESVSTGRKYRDHYMDLGHEIMFDAANCVRMGTRILMNVCNENQRLGAEWLQSILGKDYKVLTAPLADSHIDSTFLPLKPGVAIIMKERTRQLLPKELQDWDLVYVPLRERSKDEFEKQGLRLASPRIELNVLSINPETIICHPQYADTLNENLAQYNIRAIGAPIRHCEIFSGGHHCVTLDVRRNGTLEEYFK